MSKTSKRRDMCPACKVVALKPAYYKKMSRRVLRWHNKDVYVCPTEFCTVLATHTNNRVLYLIPERRRGSKPQHDYSVSARVLDGSQRR